MTPFDEQIMLAVAQELKINPDKREIDDFTYEDLTLTGYESHKKIPMQMAV